MTSVKEQDHENAKGNVTKQVGNVNNIEGDVGYFCLLL